MDNHTAAVIWLHGLGADGNDFVPIVNQLNISRSKGVRFIFPHAPYRSVTINGGMTMRAWYDVMSLDRNGVQDEIGIQKSSAFLEGLIQREYDRGIAYNKIITALKPLLKSDITILFEIGYDQGKKISNLMRESEIMYVKVFKDYSKKPRFVLGTNKKNLISY